MIAIDDDGQLRQLRLLRKDYESAIQEETDSVEQWRLRKILHELHCYILELEAKSQKCALPSLILGDNSPYH